MTTVDNVLHTLWTRHMDGDYDKDRDKPLWMLLQNFIEQNGGLKQSATRFDVAGSDPAKLAARVAPVGPKNRACTAARSLLRFLT